MSTRSWWRIARRGTGWSSWSSGGGKLTGAEVDELVDLYQRVSTHLSMVRSASTDSVLVGRLSGLVARARSAVTGAHAPLWSEFVRFWTVSFPVVAYRAWRWWLGTAVAFFFVAALIALWVSGNHEVQSALKTPSEIDRIGQPRLRRPTTARTPPGRSRCRCG